MKYSIKVNEVRAKEGSNIKGFATVVFGDSFKITNIAILENKDKGELFVSMPRYRSNERDESNGVIYKDVCTPITAEFREELYTNILDAYARIREPEKEETQKQDRTREMPEFSVTVTPYPQLQAQIAQASQSNPKAQAMLQQMMSGQGVSPDGQNPPLAA